LLGWKTQRFKIQRQKLLLLRRPVLARAVAADARGKLGSPRLGTRGWGWQGGMGAAPVPANGTSKGVAKEVAKEVAAGMATPLRDRSIRAATEGAVQMHGIPHCGQSMSGL
jgi:hypothetical protein